LNLPHILKIVLLTTTVVLLVNAAAISRDYQDSWTLEGIEIAFVVFVVTYAITFFSEKRSKWMVALAVIGRSVFLLIPSLKYVWFMGRSIDDHRQFAMANYVYNEGHIIPSEHLGDWTDAWTYYATTPLIHLSFSILSITSSIPLLYSFKFLPILLSPIYPLLTYAIVTKLGFKGETTVLRYALFLSSLPIKSGLVYIVTGSMLGVLLTFFVLLCIVRVLRRSNQSDWLLLIIFSCALMMTHSFSSLHLALLILGIKVMQRFSFFQIRSYLNNLTVSLILLLNMAWLVFRASGTFTYMTKIMTYLVGISPQKQTYYVPERFFELTSLNIFESLKVILVYYGADGFLLLLMIIVIFVFLLKSRKKSDTLKFLWLLNVLLSLLLVFAFVSRLGAGYWKRIVRYTEISYPIFFGMLIAYIDKRKIRSAVATSLLVTTLVLVPLELYACQPIIGSASTISRELPANEPVVYVGSVNSIYQREMIGFAEDYVRGSIACDGVTRNQISGLTERGFSKTLLWFYPFSGLLDESIPRKNYDYFLIHLPGKSGAFEEQAEIRTRSLILEALYDESYNIVYSNSESYVLNRWG